MEVDFMDSSFELHNNFGGRSQRYSNIVNYPKEDVHNEVFSGIINYPSEDVNNEVFSNVVNYPQEDVHNEVFSGADSMISDQYNFEIFSGVDNEETETTKKEFDAQKYADTITAVGSATGSVVGTIQAFQDPSKKADRKTARGQKKAQKKTLQDACGKKPLLKKNRAEYDKCVANYNASLRTSPATASTPSTNETGSEGGSTGTGRDNKKMLMYLGIGAVVLVAGYLIYKKKFAKP